MVEISLAMIVRDEETNLGRCLASTKGLFDEIVIADTGSVDNTKVIATTFGATIHDFTWIDDFSAARNFVFSKCTKPYIMWMDADDILSGESKEHILRLKGSLDKFDAYFAWYNYAHNAENKPICRFKRIRIVRAGDKHWRYPVHECIVPDKSWKILDSDFAVDHRRSMSDQVKDRGRNISILENLQNKDARMQFYFGKELAENNRPMEALVELQKYLLMPDAQMEDALYASYFVANIFLNLGKVEACRQVCMNAIEMDPRRAEFHCLIGLSHLRTNNFVRAGQWFEIASNLPIPEVPGVVQSNYYGMFPLDKLALCQSKIGRGQQCLSTINRILAISPNDKRALTNKEQIQNALKLNNAPNIEPSPEEPK
jgi:glycosyltransferase involved in cell wall biosynthesis